MKLKFLKKTLNIAIKDSLFLSQARKFTQEIKKNNPEIGKIYNKLLNQANSSKPISCNFTSDVVDYWAKKPDKIAIRSINQDNGEKKQITYEELVDHSHQVANYFTEEAQISKGSAVALMLGQKSEWWYCLAGLMRAGIAVVPCSRLLTSKDLSYRINDLGIQGIITIPELQSRIDAIQSECPTLKTQITTGLPTENWVSIQDILKQEKVISNVVTTTTEDPCLYLYTSGTTGQPKAVQHNFDYPFFHYPTGRRWLKATEDDLIFNASDTGWGFTVWITTAAWAMGAELLIAPTNNKFNPLQILSILQNEPVTIFCAAPTVLRLLAAHPDFDRFDFHKLKRIVTVGEALDETVIERFRKRGIEIMVGFGQAETPLIIGRVDEQSHTPNSMGSPINPYNVVVLDEDYKLSPPGDVGQIAVELTEGKNKGIMRGYANAPEKTQKTRSPDGRYYLTGDYAINKDGLFFYQGRRDDLIKSNGYRIGPDEVEKAGMSHKAVAKIAVVGVRTNPDSAAITVKAFILLKPEYTENSDLIQEIQDHIKRETGAYKYPRLVECLPLDEWEKYETTSGKIRRAGLREREEKKLKMTQEDNNNNLKLI